ncbi:hypothetical protein BDQ17DRAFT_1251365, partial [Cyathus striatus]
IHHKLTIEQLIDYPLGAIIEYPVTASTPDGAIGHRFAIDPHSKYHPKANVQNSLGDKHGGITNAYCGSILKDEKHKDVLCKQLKTSCIGLKVCQYYSVDAIALINNNQSPSLEESVFSKTLSFYCAVHEIGCSFNSVDLSDYSGEPESNDENSGNICSSELATGSNTICSGRMILSYNKFNEPRLQCQFWKYEDRAHLVLRNLQDFDIDYLSALISDDKLLIKHHEEKALRNGYGPLTGCIYQASPSQQQDKCSFWHRDSKGRLQRGSLRLQSKCKVKYSIYTPHDLHLCPQVVIISKGIHSHSPPLRVKTPPPIIDIFNSMLLELGWKLSDATPQTIMIDSGFVSALQRHLGWKSALDPPLSQLHPSLGNLDHVRRLIGKLRHQYFPNGTGFDGAVYLTEIHSSLPEHEQYVRCAESHYIEGNKLFHLVICMSKAMAFALIHALYISIDTSFKRVHGKWQEFEMETWDTNGMKSIVGARAFTTSQSVRAHFILFKRIFDFATKITGLPVQFQHIHGTGYYIWIADAHKGQALGVGLYCEMLCQDLKINCPVEPARRMKDLTPYDHLRRFYRLCTVHFKRHINYLRSYETTEVIDAMYSLASTTMHDITPICDIIRNSGTGKAKAWLNDKLKTKFVIPAINQKQSLIPLRVWQSSPSSTNGNEQSHRDINRDGINLTMLGGIMHGMQYDFRIHSSVALLLTQGINMRDQFSTDFYRSERSVTRQLHSQSRAASQSPKKPRVNKHGVDALHFGKGSAPIPQPVFSTSTSGEFLNKL